MIRGAAAAATEDAAATAAQAVVEAGGGAVDAVIAGFFGAAGARPGVLFAPALALVAGFGSGGRVFDGRPAQPGRGAPRPRGFVQESEIPPGARVAVPRTIAMLVLMSGYRGKAALSELARYGVLSAEAASCKARAKLVRRVGAAGVLAMRASEVQTALLAVGGPVAGGALTAADLEEVMPTEAEAATTTLADGTLVYSSPFPHIERDAEVIVTCDARGGLAALAYASARDGLPLAGLEVSIGFDAVPVRRGVTRLAPGTVLPAPMPLAVAVQSGSLSVVLGSSGTAAIDAGDFGWLASGMPLATALAELRERKTSRSAVGILSDGKTARVAASVDAG